MDVKKNCKLKNLVISSISELSSLTHGQDSMPNLRLQYLWNEYG